MSGNEPDMPPSGPTASSPTNHGRIPDSASYTTVKPILETLERDIQTLKSDFYKIRGYLAQLPAQKSGATGSVDEAFIEKRKQEWSAIIEDDKDAPKKFDDLVWKSRRVATSAATQARAYRNVMIPLIRGQDYNIALSVKIHTLGQFISNLELTHNSAEELARGFQKIPEDIQDFKAHITSMPNHLPTTAQNAQKIKNLDREIEELAARMANRDVWSRINWKTTTSAVATTVVVGVGLHALCGPVATGMMLARGGVALASGAGVAALVSYWGDASHQGDIDRKRKEIESLNDLEALRGSAKLVQTTASDICAKLSSMEQVWAVIRTEAQALYEGMKNAKETGDNFVFELFMSDAMVGNPYAELEAVLSAYASYVVAWRA